MPQVNRAMAIHSRDGFIEPRALIAFHPMHKVGGGFENGLALGVYFFGRAGEAMYEQNPHLGRSGEKEGFSSWDDLSHRFLSVDGTGSHDSNSSDAERPDTCTARKCR
jgi:hypothetical protein